MNLLLHHVRKDLRHSRWLIAVTWLAAAGILWLPATPVELRHKTFEWLPFIRYGSWVLLFLTIGRIVQLDSPVRDTAFLRSRPVSTNEWLASKLITTCIVMLPMALLQVAMILLAGLRPEFIDQLLIFAEEMLSLAVVVTLAMALAARSKTLSHFITIVMGIVFASFIIFAVYVNADELFPRATKPVWGYDIEYLKLSRLLITQVIAVLFLLAGLFFCIRARQPERLKQAMAGTVLLAALAWFFWPVNFVSALAPARRAAPLSDWPDQSRLQFMPDFQFHGRDEEKSHVRFSDGTWNDLKYRSIRGTYSMNGLPDGWQCAHNAYESEVSLANGRILPSRRHAWGPVNMQWILPELGINPGFDRTKPNLFSIDYAEINLADAAGALEGASVKGLLHIPLKRAVVLARVPFKPGVSTRIGNRRITITQVEHARSDSVSYNIIEERFMNRLRGGWFSVSQRHIDVIVINPQRREFLKNQSSGSSNRSCGSYSVTHINNDAGFDYFSRKDRTIPPDWLDGAELLIVGEEYGGTFSKSFEFTDVSLSNP